MGTVEASAIHRGVATKYREVALSPEGLFRYPTGERSALGLGYDPALVASIPAEVRTHFVGVGDPFALGEIHRGAAVLDLGCGAGFDALVAGALVGLRGRVLGIDLSAEMLAVAEAGRVAGGAARVTFCAALVEALPFRDASFDVALSNGVLNMVPDKPGTLREIFRVLRPGGRLQACDMGLVGENPPPDRAPWSD